MPLEGDSNFKALKKSYAKGVELKGKTLGIIRIWKNWTGYCKNCHGFGMKVIAFDPFIENAAHWQLEFFDGQQVIFTKYHFKRRCFKTG